MEISKEQAIELNGEFNYVFIEEIIYKIAPSYKTINGLKKKLNALNKEREIAYNAPLPTSIDIEVLWHKNKTWGPCPRVNIRWVDNNGEYHHDDKAGYANGCGYDKHSAAVAAALNKHFQSLLWKAKQMGLSKEGYPNGLAIPNGWKPYFEGGIGMECYYKVFEFLGYKLEYVYGNRHTDVWKITKTKE